MINSAVFHLKLKSKQLHNLLTATTPKIFHPELSFLRHAGPLMRFNIYMKFHEGILKSFLDTELCGHDQMKNLLFSVSKGHIS